MPAVCCPNCRHRFFVDTENIPKNPDPPTHAVREFGHKLLFSTLNEPNTPSPTGVPIYIDKEKDDI